MAVPVETAPGFEAGSPQLLFEARFRQDQGLPYEVSADGKEFLVDPDVAQASEAPITLVQNWLAGRKH